MLTPEDVTIGISTRERYSMAPLVIDRIKEATPAGTQILFVEAGVPDKYRDPAYEALERFGRYIILRYSDYLLPIQATNRLIVACNTAVLALVESDVMVEDRWLEPVLREMNATGVDFVSPVIRESRQTPGTPDEKLSPHFDPDISSITMLDSEKMVSNVRRVPPKNPQVDLDQARIISHMERHAFFGRTDSFRQIAPFPDFLNTREQVVISIAIHTAGMKILFLPESRVTYYELPLNSDEIPNYLQRWDLQRGQMSNDYVQSTWQLSGYRSSMGDIQGRIAKAEVLMQQFSKV